MGRAYADAVQLVQREAERQRDSFVAHREICSIFEACDRTVHQTICSPIATPKFDTSAMDGFALSSAAALDATPQSPKTFQIIGMTTAGDEPHSGSGITGDGIPPCVEIMTGAPFPVGVDSDLFDCCVQLEDVVVNKDESNRRYISVSKPAKRHQNRRFAGSDFSESDRIAEAGECLRPEHIMALASVGLTEISVMRKPRVAVFSTGCELLQSNGSRPSHSFMIHDANGPYITVTLRKWGADVDFAGAVRDSPAAMEEEIIKLLNRKQHDVILTSGAVSAGRSDMIPGVVERIGGRTVFHKVAVKPGHPILFSMIPRATEGETAFFGLPGNPVASAACLRFFVLPYLRTLQLQNPEKPQLARVRCHEQGGVETNSVLSFRKDPDVFRPAISMPSSTGLDVQIIQDHSPGKTKPFLHANCWARIANGVSELHDGDAIDIYPFHSDYA